MNLLDCTLRDGGYYTNWNFETEMVQDLVRTLDQAKVEVIELGYKSPKKGGRYRKCNDKFIWEVLEYSLPSYSTLAFMIDAKDFVKDSKVDFSLIDDVIHSASSSPFNICRLAIKYDELKYALEIGKYIQRKGYNLIVNIMGISLLTDKDIKLFEQLRPLGLQAIYFADSYGNLTPDRVEYFAEKFFKLGIDVGIHTHDNLGLAFANSLQAWKSGVRYIDGTLLGMGRGVGNVKTEQLISYFESQELDYISKPVNKFVYKWMKPLLQEHNWGFTHNYLISGLKHIHPLYVQTLQATHLNSSMIENIIHDISNPQLFDIKNIEDKMKPTVAVVIPARYKSSRFPGKPLAKIKGKEMVIRVAEIAEKAVGIDNVYIATENEEIVDVVKNYGYKVILTSDDCLTGTDRVAEASLEINADIIVNVQGDEPLLDYNDIVRVIEAKKKFPSKIINCFAYLNKNESVEDKKIPKVVMDVNSDLLYSSRNPIPGTKLGNGKHPTKQVCIYAFDRDQLKDFTRKQEKTPLEFEEDIEILRFIELGYKVHMIEVDGNSVAVDYPNDIKLVEQLL